MKRVLLNSSLCSGEVPKALKRYLRERVTPLHIHRFDPGDVQFADALVSSAVVWFRNIPPPLDQSVMFSFLSDGKVSSARPSAAAQAMSFNQVRRYAVSVFCEK